MNQEALSRAWDLVCGYVRARGANPDDLDREQQSPLGALLRFEFDRQKLSYARAAIVIARALPETWTGSVIGYSGLHSIVTDPTIRTTTPTLEQLSYAFGWDMMWLRMVNGEEPGTAIPGIELPAMRELLGALQADVQLTELLQIAAQLPDAERRAALAMIRSLAASVKQKKANHY